MGLRYISVGDVLASALYQIKIKGICQGMSLARISGVHYSTQNARTDLPRCWERIARTFLCLAWPYLPVTSSIRRLREFYWRTNSPINRILTFIVVIRTLYTGRPENKFTMHIFVCRVSSVAIANRYGLDSPGMESRWGRDFPHPSRPALGPTQPPIQWVPGLYQ
jgi:hypothetical protein